jgi:hypothetical protein
MRKKAPMNFNNPGTVNGQFGQFDRIDIHNHAADPESAIDQIPVRVGRHLKKRIRRAAERDGMATSEFCRTALELLLNYEKAARSAGLPMTDALEDALNLYLNMHRPEEKEKIIRQIVGKMLISDIDG